MDSRIDVHLLNSSCCGSVSSENVAREATAHVAGGYIIDGVRDCRAS